MNKSDEFKKAAEELKNQIHLASMAIAARLGATSGAVVVTASEHCNQDAPDHNVDNAILGDIGSSLEACRCEWLAYRRWCDEWGVVVYRASGGLRESTPVRLEDMPVVDRVRCANRLGDLVEAIEGRNQLHISAVEECAQYVWRLHCRLRSGGQASE